MTNATEPSPTASVPGLREFAAYGVDSATSELARRTVVRRNPGPNDVELDILYCGVCHSDLHQVRNEWHNTVYPCVPGHEIVGRVRALGAQVQRFKVGDLVGVGCMVDSCQSCPNCQAGVEQYCTTGATFTYNSPDVHLADATTYGGYSKTVVVDEKFVLRVPASLNPAAAAPLLCAGITTWSPLRHWKVGAGQKVGIIGLGGLGHMGVKFARALGAHVVVITTSERKREDALKLGAHEVIVSSDADQMAQHAVSFDFLLDAVSADHDLNTYMQLLKLDGTLTLVGAPENPLPVSAFTLLLPRRHIAGSAIGGIAETQEMLDFCGEHQILPEIEMISIQQINEAYERLLRQDVRYRFVIDMATLQ